MYLLTQTSTVGVRGFSELLHLLPSILSNSFSLLKSEVKFLKSRVFKVFRQVAFGHPLVLLPARYSYRSKGLDIFAIYLGYLQSKTRRTTSRNDFSYLAEILHMQLHFLGTKIFQFLLEPIVTN